MISVALLTRRTTANHHDQGSFFWGRRASGSLPSEIGDGERAEIIIVYPLLPRLFKGYQEADDYYDYENDNSTEEIKVEVEIESIVQVDQR